jgi:hypothetical protein
MAPSETPPTGNARTHRWSFSRAIAALGGLFFLAFGTWAMVAPRRFFKAAAAFEPYNQHFVQDIGAFQVGLGAVLVLSVLLARADALTTGLLGVGIARRHTSSPTSSAATSAERRRWTSRSLPS